MPLLLITPEGNLDKLLTEIVLDVAVTGRVSLPPTPLYSVDDETVKDDS